VYDDGSYGHFAGFERALGGAQGFLHPQFVGGEFVRQWQIRSRLRRSLLGSCCRNSQR
jgi:hypothetical protein